MRFFDNYKQTQMFWTIICSCIIFGIGLGSLLNIDDQRTIILSGLVVFCSGLILTITLYYLQRNLPMNESTKSKECQTIHGDRE